MLDQRASQIPVGQNRKRGRPANTTGALETQPEETQQPQENNAQPQTSDTQRRRR